MRPKAKGDWAYQSTLTVHGDARLYTSFIAERPEPADRSRFKVTKIKDGAKFDISARDAVALRAAFNSIARLLVVFEKVSSIGTGKKDQSIGAQG